MKCIVILIGIVSGFRYSLYSYSNYFMVSRSPILTNFKVAKILLTFRLTLYCFLYYLLGCYVFVLFLTNSLIFIANEMI